MIPRKDAELVYESGRAVALLKPLKDRAAASDSKFETEIFEVFEALYFGYANIRIKKGMHEHSKEENFREIKTLALCLLELRPQDDNMREQMANLIAELAEKLHY